MSLWVRSPSSSRTLFSLLTLCALAALELACGGGSTKIQTSVPPVPPAQLTFSHVILVVEENHSYAEVMGNSSMQIGRASCRERV